MCLWGEMSSGSSYVTTLNQNPPIGLRKSISRFSTPLIPFPKKDLPENAPGFTKSPLLALQKVSHSFTPHPHCKNHHGRGPSFMTTQDTLSSYSFQSFPLFYVLLIRMKAGIKNEKCWSLFVCSKSTYTIKWG